ncbi:coiled-coil domain-containing protein mad1 [Coemansia sp. RSA 2599]|nr:coiled-coil domain-containing protein mad1 [Coemansia sp. RSA 2598]KAJ1827037.1 coiled-coil domain-containing protein mad1 [Coemansia sp. RSA 2599]
MLPPGSDRPKGETPGALKQTQFKRQNSTSAVPPPSTVIRSRFRSITEKPAAAELTVSRGTKRYLLDDGSPNIAGNGPASWMLSLETPIRSSRKSSQGAAALVDTILRPQQLFGRTPPTASKLSTVGEQSPARSILDSVSRERESIGKIESLRRAAERAKFEAQQVEMERERDREEALRTKQALETDIRQYIKRVEKLERDRKWLYEQEQRLIEQRREAEEEAAAQKQRFEKRVDELTKHARTVQQQVDDTKQVMRQMASEHMQEKETLYVRLARAERTAAEAQRRLESLDRASGDSVGDAALRLRISALEHEINNRDEDIADLQQQLAAANGASAKTDSTDAAATPARGRVVQLERDLKEQCAYIKAVEQQNQQLRAEVRRLTESATNNARDSEETRALRNKVKRLEARQEAYAETQAQLDMLKQERDQWMRVFGDSSAENEGARFGSPFAVAKAVAEQRQTIQKLEKQAESLREAADSAHAQLSRATSEEQVARQECHRLETAIATGQQHLTQTESARRHLEREVEFLRDQLRSYDREEATMSANYDAQKAERIALLERFIDEQRSWIAEKGSADALPALSGDLLRKYREEADAKQQELDAIRDEHQRLTRQFEALEKETARLEHQVGAGLGYNPRTTRILQLIDNPSAQDFAIRSEKLAALTAENSALLERIRELEQRPGAPKDATSSVSKDDAADAPPESSPFFHTIDNLRNENRNLTQQLEDSIKLISRYKKEWKRKAAELREVVYSILGYRVDFLANGSVRFTSMYAADIDESFVFTSGDDNLGVMRLSGGGSKAYLMGLSNDIRYWVQERGSIPGFMATITLQGFENQSDQAGVQSQE